MRLLSLPNGNRISDFRIVKTDDVVMAARKYTLSGNCAYCHNEYEASVLADYSHDPFMELIEAINNMNEQICGCSCISHAVFTPSRRPLSHNAFYDSFLDNIATTGPMTATQVRERLDQREAEYLNNDLTISRRGIDPDGGLRGLNPGNIEYVDEEVPRNQRPGRSSDLPDDGR